jgi:hypothetical protein
VRGHHSFEDLHAQASSTVRTGTPVRLDASSACDLIVTTTTGLKLPLKAAFDKPEVLHQQPLEALIGRAVLYGIAPAIGLPLLGRLADLRGLPLLCGWCPG